MKGIKHSLLATALCLFGCPPILTLRTTAYVLLWALPVVVVVGFFAGSVLMLQAVEALAVVTRGTVSAHIVGLGGVRELFPILAMASVASTAGAIFSSQLANMKVAEEIAAIEVMGIDPYRILVAPRVAASMIGTAIIVVIANGIGLLSAYLVGTYQLGFDGSYLWSQLLMWLRPSDFSNGVLKGLVFGWLIGLISTYEGLYCKPSATTVGHATRKAVVKSMVAGCCAGFLMTILLYGLL